MRPKEWRVCNDYAIVSAHSRHDNPWDALYVLDKQIGLGWAVLDQDGVQWDWRNDEPTPVNYDYKPKAIPSSTVWVKPW